MASTAARERQFRYKTVVALLAVSVFINYIDRGNLSIAAPLLKDELGLTPARLGVLLSAFFWTYTVLQLAAGWLVDRFDESRVLAVGFLVWSLATALTGAVYGFAALLMARLALGLGESVAFPAYSKIIAREVPEEKRGFTNSIIIAGLHLGPALGTLFGGILMARFGWRPFFLVFGFASLLWLVPWLAWTPRRRDDLLSSSTASPSAWEILAQRSAWGACIGQFAGNYVLYFMVTWMPFYLVREQHMSMVKMANVGAVAYLVGAATATVCGWLSDRWIASGASVTIVRKTFTAGGLTLGATFLLLCAYAGAGYAPLLLSLAMAGSAMSGSNLFAISQTLAGPRAAGRWVGIQNALSNLAGVAAPAITGLVVQRTGTFTGALAIAAAVCVAGALSWIFVVGPVRQVEWRSAPNRETAATSQAAQGGE